MNVLLIKCDSNATQSVYAQKWQKYTQHPIYDHDCKSVSAYLDSRKSIYFTNKKSNRVYFGI